VSRTEEDASKQKAIHSVTRRIMWGEEQSSVLQSLIAKGHSESDARDLVRTAFRDRVRTIRRIYRPKIWWGLLLIGLGLGIVFGFRILTDSNPPRKGAQIFVELAPFVYGSLQFLMGLNGMLTAGSRSGPVSEID